MPAQRMVVKALDQRGFDHLKVGRHVKVARHEQAVVAHMQDFIDAQGAQRVLRGTALDDRQYRVGHRLKHLGDQRRTNRARRVATAQRQHAPPPLLRHRRCGQQKPHQVHDVFQVVLVAEAAARVCHHLRGLLGPQADGLAHSAVQPGKLAQRHRPHTLQHVRLDDAQRFARVVVQAQRVAHIQRGM